MHDSVFELAGLELSGQPKNNIAARFFIYCMLMNVRFKDSYNEYISYTTQQIIELVKAEDYAKNFKGGLEIGKNIVFPVSTVFHSNKNRNLIMAANDKNIETPHEVKIVVHGYECSRNLQQLVREGEYPLSVISTEEALKELLTIHDGLKLAEEQKNDSAS